jgi:hypothetical protein
VVIDFFIEGRLAPVPSIGDVPRYIIGIGRRAAPFGHRIMERVEIKARKIATAAAADVVIQPVSPFSGNNPFPVNPTNNKSAAKTPSAPNAI